MIEDLHRFCAENNTRCKRLSLDSWYIVRSRPRDDGSRLTEVVKLEGNQAIEARANAEGRRIEVFKPEPWELRDIHRSVADFIRDNPGTFQSEFNRLVERGQFR
jgi:hypothetical protein